MDFALSDKANVFVVADHKDLTSVQKGRIAAQFHLFDEPVTADKPFHIQMGHLNDTARAGVVAIKEIVEELFG